MRILLISTTPIRQGCEALGLPSNYNGAGWVEGVVERLSLDNELYMSFLYHGIDDIKMISCGNITFIALPMKNAAFEEMGSDTMLPQYLGRIDARIHPEIVQMFGTETQVTKNVVSVFGAKRTVVHLTGLVGPYASHFMGGLTDWETRNQTIRDILKGGIRHGQKIFERNAVPEAQAIKECKYVMGRTTWDRACAEQMNANVRYFHCDEMLRNVFYTKEWNYDQCQKHSIFVSSSASPLKGFHKVLDAMPLILNRFPDAQLIVTGKDVMHLGTIGDHLRLTSYGRLLVQKVRKHHLEEHVHFVGSLNADEMLKQYLNANVFVLPSNIENSPNSLGEAMLLGVPCVAAYVGGIPDMLADKKEGFLYPFDEPYMLAHYVCTLFENSDLAKQMGRNAHVRALETHDRAKIAQQLVNIYKEVVENK